MKKRILAVLLGILCVAAAFGIAALADAQGAQRTVYEYALLGDTYTVGEGFLSGTTPTGEAIPADTQLLLLNWAQGSYRLSYEDKTVDLRVYESAPEDCVTTHGEVPGQAVAGLETVFPAVTVESGIRRTDGAPEVGSYSVSAVLWHGGERVQTVRNLEESFAFVPQQAGLWVLSYEYTDVFGRLRTVDHPFVVSAERIIVSALQEEYYVGQSIAVSEIYGYYEAKQYPVTAEAVTPDGETVPVSGKLTLSQPGTYELVLTSEILGQSVTSKKTLTVLAGLASYATVGDGFKQGTVGTNHSNVEALSGSDSGLLLDMSGTTASVSYNGIVDLRKLGSRTPVISFTPNHSYGGSISKVTVTLTDAYDPSISLSVQFARNSNATATAMSFDNTTIRTTYGSTSVAVANYYPLQTDSVAWNTSFHSYWRSEAHTDPNKTYDPAESLYSMNFAYDTETNTVYSYGLFQLVEWGDRTAPEGFSAQPREGWYPIADLGSDALTSPFGGFTTGEVRVTLTVESGRGDIMLHSIGGVTAATASAAYGTDTSLLLGSFDGSLPAAVGVPYALPAGTGGGATDVQLKVLQDGSELAVENGSFTAEKTGTCRIIYSAVNQFGRAITREISVSAIEKPELTVGYERENLTYGEVYTVLEPKISGYGAISYTMTLNGEPVRPGQRVLVAEEMTLTVTASDALEEKTLSYSLNVDTNVLSFDIDFPRAAKCGTEFAFPEAVICDHSSGNLLDYGVYVGGVRQGASMTLPQTPGKLTVEYRTAKGSRSYELLLRSAGEITSGAEALVLPSGASAETNEAGTVVTVLQSDLTVGLPYKLSANNLSVQFVVLEEDLNFDTMAVRLWDKNGTAVTVSIEGLKLDEPVLYIGGRSTGCKLAKQAQTYTDGPYADKLYYTYTLTYDNYYRAMLSASKVLSYVTEDDRGLAFAGFNGGVYMDLCPGALDSGAGKARFILAQVSNQYFYTSAFEYGDGVGPALSTTDFFIGNNYIRSGYVLRLKNLWAYDVLQPASGLTVTLTAPNGTTIFQEADPAQLDDVTLDQTGIYMLKLVANDGNTGRSSTTYQFNVEDVTPPELTLAGAVPETATAGKSVTLPGVTATDDNDVTVQLIVYMPNGKVLTLTGTDSLDSYTFTATVSGCYKVRYIAKDKRGNVQTESYTIYVEGAQ